MLIRRIWAIAMFSALLPLAAANCVGSGGNGGDGAAGGGGSAELKWYFTCGDPVCSGHEAQSGVDLCTTQKAGDSCSPGGSKCDPNNPCNSLLLCTTSDPTTQPGGCPISRARFKHDIRYLSDAELKRIHDDLLAMRLTTWRYNHDAPGAREHLGFIIDDNPDSPSVAESGNHVDLYGYTSMAVAALKSQQKQIDTLEQELGALREELKAARKEPALCSEPASSR